MTIAILKQAPGQKIARPFNRASTLNEAHEMLYHWKAMTPGSTVQLLRWPNLDSDRPVFQHAGHKFYAFTEE